MEHSKGPGSIRNVTYGARNSLLPPKIPFPNTVPSVVDYVPNSGFGSKGTQNSREDSSHHQRTSSESLLIEEQPSWLDELLNEPETPVRRGGHRRSSSDSFTYLDAANLEKIGYVPLNESKFKQGSPLPWGSQDFHPLEYPAPGNILPSPRMTSVLRERDAVSSVASEGQISAESGPEDSKGSSEKKDNSHGKSSNSETDTKRTKQQFAQRSRVRKLQYIAELERNVQALQAEGSEVSAELEFINQQNLILSLENKALKQRLESLTQEQLIKYLEHEVLEKEIGRLRALYQQQQQPQQQLQQQQPQQQLQQHQGSGHRRNKSKDLDQQLANLSLKPKDNPTRGPISGQLYI